MTEALRLSDFAPHLHTRFRVADADGCELELVEASDVSNAALEQFSLIFLGAAPPWLSQGTYRLDHAQIRGCELFLVPIGPAPGGMRYQAVFTRFVPPQERA